MTGSAAKQAFVIISAAPDTTVAAMELLELIGPAFQSRGTIVADGHRNGRPLIDDAMAIRYFQNLVHSGSTRPFALLQAAKLAAKDRPGTSFASHRRRLARKLDETP